jgi:hypothetical protein
MRRRDPTRECHCTAIAISVLSAIILAFALSAVLLF